MKRLLILCSIMWLGLSAQTPTAVTPAATGVSDIFQNYARSNAPTPTDTEEVEIPNQFYIPRNPMLQPIIAPSVASTPSTMYNQTTSGNLPVGIIASYVGLGNGFNGWTNQNLLPPDTTLAVGSNQIVQWVNLRLTVLNKSTGALLLGGSGYVNGNQVWSGLPPTSVCRTRNQGDPVLQYDRMSNRWVLSQFAFNIATATASPFR